jgi:hypothetical protein
MQSQVHFVVLVVCFLVQGSVNPLDAQEAGDICPLGMRLSSGRSDRSCLDIRRLPLPPSPAVGTISTWALLPLRNTGSYRSAYPADRNNGVQWSGRGLSSAMSGGFRVQRGRLILSVEPEIAWAQNLGFSLPDTTTPGLSMFSYPWGNHGLDRFLRPGSGSSLELDPGASFLEVGAGPLSVGISSEPLWWGPARRYPLLFSGTSGGFPHAYAERSLPLETALGGFTGRLLWGRLQESPWYDADPENNRTLIGAFQLGWRIDFVPGLEVAYAVVRHEPLPAADLNLGQLGQLLTGDPDGEDPARTGTTMGTFSVRLGFPQEGFEAYAEIGRGEGFLNPVPGVSDTRVSQIYVLGFARTDTSSSGGRWRVSGELMKQAMELPQPDAPTPDPTTYSPRRTGHGHTHRGQLLGSWIGPGSNAQYLAVDWLWARHTFGFFAERARRDDDTYFRVHAFDYSFRGHDLEWTLGVRGGGQLGGEQTMGPVGVGVEMAISRRKNRDFVGLDGGNRVFLREWNAWADVYLVWTPRPIR